MVAFFQGQEGVDSKYDYCYGPEGRAEEPSYTRMLASVLGVLPLNVSMAGSPLFSSPFGPIKAL